MIIKKIKIYAVFLQVIFLSNVLSQNQCATIDTNLCYSSEPFPVVDFAIEKKFESQENTATYQSPLLADIDGDCIPEIIMAGTSNYQSNPNLSSGITILNSQTGNTISNIPTAFYGVHGPTGFVLADVDFDGIPEIIVAAAGHTSNPINVRGKLVCYNLDGSIKWISDEQFGENVTYKFAGSLGLADFNQDGIPEVYIYNEIFNAQTGIKLCDGGNNGLGGVNGGARYGFSSIVIAGQLDDNLNDLELAAGFTIYKVLINNPNGQIGNSMIPNNIMVDGEFRDGYTSVADINQDGILDVIVSSNGVFPNARLYVYSFSGGVLNIIAKTSPTNSNCSTCSRPLIGPPFVGKIDNSGILSIGITRAEQLITYKYNGTQNLQLNWSITTNDRSGRTGMTMFDFNQDGVQEIVYRDETNLRIIDGSVNPPVDLAVFDCFAGTVVEYPLVGDIDNTGESKICVTCGNSNSGINGTVGKLTVFGAPTGQQPWSPSRGVWNQYAYHVFNVNDDLTIPTQQKNNATFANGAYNNFYVQQSLLDENGNFLQQVADLSGEINCVNYDIQNEEYTVTFNIANAENASLQAPSGIEVAFFNGNPETSGALIGVYTTTNAINQGDTLNNLSFTFSATNLTELYMVVNTDGSTTGVPYIEDTYNIGECGYGNNIISTTNLPQIEMLNESICQGDEYDFYGTLYSTAGTYFYSVQNNEGCDSLVSKLELDVFGNNTTSSFTASSCEDYFWAVTGEIYTQSGEYSFDTVSVNGCDSSFVLNLTILDCPNQCSTIDTNLCYASEPFPVVDFAIEKKFESQENTAIYQSPLLADIDGDCIPEIIMAGTTDFQTSPRLTSGIRIINSQTGNTISNIPTAFYGWGGNGSFAVADVDFDGVPEFIIASADHTLNPLNLRGRLICYNFDGTIKWVSNEIFGSNFTYKYGGSIGLADFNQDGIPEVYIYNEIFNAQTGIKLCDGGNNGSGSGFSSLGSGTSSVSIAAQLDNDLNDLELAAGYTVYKVQINNIAGQAGNIMTPYNIQIDGQLRDGYTSVGDINQDGQLEIIVSSRGFFPDGKLYVYSFDGSNTNIVASTSPPSSPTTFPGMGAPFIGDIDGSGIPSIGITRSLLLLTYKYNGTQNLQLNWSISTNDRSGETGITMFDFNQDGVQEIIYRDETTLRIINGSVNPPNILASFPCFSNTGQEYSIVGDIDNTGDSKICVTCGTSTAGINGLVGKLNVFGAPTGQQPWAPSRGVWNQYAYHVFNVNDDLTIPTQQKNNATFANGAYNNFYVQASLLDEDANFLQQVADLSGEINCVNYDIQNEEYTVTFNIANAENASLQAPSGIEVAFFNGNPETSGALIGVYTTTNAINQGDTLNNLSFTFSATNLTELYMVVNTDGSTTGVPYIEDTYNIGECGYGNNIISTTNLPQIEMLNESICQGDEYDFYGTLYSTAGTYFYSVQNNAGCDSLVSKLELDVNNTFLFTETLSSCDAYTWTVNGQTYTNSGTYTEVLQTQFGCDSTLVLELTINESVTSTETLSSCDEYTWTVNGQTYTNSGVYTEVLQTQFGCDSTLILELTINESVSSTEVLSSCDEYTWNVNGQTFTSSGTYTEVLQTQFGCDSSLILELTINESVTSTETISSCDEYTWTVNGQTYTNSGVYTEVLQTQFGCDSTLILELTINESVSSTEVLSSCDEYTWNVNGQTFTSSGTYTEVLQTQFGCDSSLILELTILNSIDTLISDSICNGETFVIGNNSYSQSGSYTINTTRLNGCDSTIIINLLVNELPIIESMDIIDESCLDFNDGQVNISVSSGTPPYIYLWNNEISNSFIDNLSPGPYNLDIIDDNECSISEEIEILPGAFINVSLGNDTLVDYGSTLNLNALVSGSLPENIIWQPSAGLSCDDCLNPSVIMEDERIFRIVVSDINGCMDDDIITVFVNDRENYCLFPTAFSPNSDGVNDFFRDICQGAIEIRLRIHNRWGELVYEEISNNRLRGWDGIYQGREAPMGVYIFNADVKFENGSNEFFKGNFTLIR